MSRISRMAGKSPISANMFASPMRGSVSDVVPAIGYTVPPEEPEVNRPHRARSVPVFQRVASPRHRRATPQRLWGQARCEEEERHAKGYHNMTHGERCQIKAPEIPVNVFSAGRRPCRASARAGPYHADRLEGRTECPFFRGKRFRRGGGRSGVSFRREGRGRRGSGRHSPPCRAFPPSSGRKSPSQET